jgi:hypothetical protein
MARKKPDCLKKGDLVLITHPMGTERVPGRMVLARFLELYHDGDQFFSQALSVLHQSDPTSPRVLPKVSGNYEGSQYVFEKVNLGHRQGWIVSMAPGVTGSKIYRGLDEVLKKLDSTRGYEPHAAALRAMLSGI